MFLDILFVCRQQFNLSVFIAPLQNCLEREALLFHVQVLPVLVTMAVTG